MPRLREEVEGLDCGYVVLCLEPAQVPGQGGGVAGDVEEPPRGQFQKACTTSGCIPARGGSVTTTSGRGWVAGS